MSNNNNKKKKTEQTIISWKTISIIIITIRILLANKTPILDCDEVYNYWEGVHSLLNNGTNYIQTWEYAPQYALRSYVYLYPMYLFSLLCGFVTDNKVIVFLMLRSIQAGVTGYCEVQYAKSFNDTTDNDSSSVIVGYIYCVLSITSSGMYHSSSSYLPSSTVMQLYIISQSFFNIGDMHKCIITGIICVLCTGWPFCIVLYIPCGLYILYHQYSTTKSAKGILHVLTFSIVLTIIVQILNTMIDTYYYNNTNKTQYIVSTYNMIKYNIQGGGDELYGVEPLSYYIKNLLLNFNYCSLLSILLTPVVLVVKKNWFMIYKLLVPMYLWILITFTRLHKEERFLYPIYPIIIYSSSLTIYEISHFGSATFFSTSNNHAQQHHDFYSRKKIMCIVIMIIPYILISMSRNIALSTYYMAPIYTFQYFYNYHSKKQSSSSSSSSSTTLCVAGEWYRYPSSFFLPSNVQLGYLSSSFKGQLPKPIYSSDDDDDNKVKYFNDLNKEEISRYMNMEKCNYIVDLRFDAEEKNKLIINHVIWKEIISFPFLDMDETNVIHRCLFIPDFIRKFVFKGGNKQFARYVLFERRKS